MLIQLTDIKGKEYWVNPLYVKAIASRKGGRAEIFITFGGEFRAVTSIKVDQDASEVAQIVSDVLSSMGQTLGGYAAHSAVEDAARGESLVKAAVGAVALGG